MHSRFPAARPRATTLPPRRVLVLALAFALLCAGVLFSMPARSDTPYLSRPEVREFIDTLESPCSDFPYRRMGPAFVLESLPNGTFGVGAGAKREGRKACPDTPKRLTVRASDDPKLVDEEGTFANIVCARAWGLSQTKVRSMLLSECKTPKKTPDRCDAGPGECPQMQAMLAWTKRTAPVSLK